MARTYFFKIPTNLLCIAVICVSFLFSCVFEIFATANIVRSECLRLHILAHSDGEEDQAVKLAVRDALLQKSEDIFDGTQTADEAVGIILQNKSRLESVANEVLGQNGFDYTAEIKIEKEYFPTREYDGVTLPAGEYTACKVVLGSGEGHNWWCIMFPSLCLPTAQSKNEANEDSLYAVFGNEGTRLVTDGGGYTVKFKIAEMFESAVNFLKKER